MDILTSAVAKINSMIPENFSMPDVVDYKIYDDRVVILVAFGIGGVKKFIIAVEDLEDTPVAALPVLPEPTSLDTIELDPAEVEAVKVDALQEQLVPKRGRKRG